MSGSTISAARQEAVEGSGSIFRSVDTASACESSSISGLHQQRAHRIDVVGHGIRRERLGCAHKTGASDEWFRTNKSARDIALRLSGSRLADGRATARRCFDAQFLLKQAAGAAVSWQV
jgi:hypothetical protein